MRSVFYILFTFFVFSSTSAKEPFFHKVPAKKGDNLITFLTRYHLHNYECNYEKFHKLNKTKKDLKLIAGKEYFIPVLIYDYNGKSIRTTVGLKEWAQAIRIKEYNEMLLEKNLRRQTLIQSAILWVPYHELNCIDKKLNENEVFLNENAVQVENPLTGPRRYAIFGKKYAHIPLANNKLKNKVFYIVSGHGGPDPGAVGKRGNVNMCEDEYAYDIALRLAKQLIARGATVYIITRDPNDGIRDENILKCDVDEYCWGNYKIPRSQKQRLFQRSNAINKLYASNKAQGIPDKNQTTIVLHIDSRNTSQRTDVFFYHFPGSDMGRKLAERIKRTLAKKYKKHRRGGHYSGTVKPRDLHMLREVKTNAVYIELGNIRNSGDQKRFMKANREILAKWMYEALAY